jgi:hypothetical protein
MSCVTKLLAFGSEESRDELHVRAKDLRIVGFRKLSKAALLSAILERGLPKPTDRPARAGWWSRYHNHVYGIVGVIGVLLTIYFSTSQHPWGNAPLAASREEDLISRKDEGATISTAPERIEARIASEAQSFSPMSLSEYYSRWSAESATELQKEALQAELRNRTVIWMGRIKSVEAGRNGGISVLVSAKEDLLYSAWLDFDASQKPELLKLTKGQLIRFTGVIRTFLVSPFLEKCRLLQVF